MGADYRRLLAALAFERPNRPVLMEPALAKPLYEQLVWRRGETLWKSEEEQAKTIIDASRIAGFDCATFQPTDPQNPNRELLQKLEGFLPDTMRIAAGDKTGPFSRFALTAEDSRMEFETLLQESLDYYELLLSCPAVCAVTVHEENKRLGDEMTVSNRLKYLDYLKTLFAMAKRWEKPVLLLGVLPGFSLQEAARFGFAGIYCTGERAISAEQALDSIGGRTAVLGGLGVPFMKSAHPTEIRERCFALLKRTGGAGYVLGSGNLTGQEIPYVNFIAMLSVAERFFYTEG